MKPLEPATATPVSAPISPVVTAPPAGGLSTNGRKRPFESVLQWVFALCAGVSVLTTFGIIFVLITESLPFFQQVALSRFFTEREWTPLFDPPHYGVLPLICGTFLVMAGAAIFTLPMAGGWWTSRVGRCRCNTAASSRNTKRCAAGLGFST